VEASECAPPGAVSHEDGHDYIYGDTGMHRAWFHPADGLVIDSSARIPIVVGNTPYRIHHIQLKGRYGGWKTEDSFMRYYFPSQFMAGAFLIHVY
jgi:hypothetical protein